MDARTLELLEFDKVRQAIAARTVTSLGQELSAQIEPLLDINLIERQLILVSEMTEALRAKLPPPLSGVSDIRMLLRRASIGSMLTASEINKVREVLEATGAIYRYRMKLDPRWHYLINLLSRIEDMGNLARTIEGSIDARSQVLDMASPALSGIRHRLHDLDERIQTELKRILRDPVVRSALRFPNTTLSGDHHVLPVAVNHRQKVPGVVHRTSSSGDTVYIEPASLANYNAERSLIKAEEEKEIGRILRHFTALIGREAKTLQVALEQLAQLDVIQAKAKYSIEFDMHRPVMNTSRNIWLHQARHPLLLQLYRSNLPDSAAKQVVPIDVRLGADYDI